MKIKSEQVFSVPVGDFSISPSAEGYKSNEGYTLAYSVKGDVFTKYETPVPANENLVVTAFPKFLKYKLVGNASDVEVKW